MIAHLIQAIGESGMTVLEELIDAAMSVCERSRQSTLQQQSHTHSRSAVLLSNTGRTYTGCDVHIASATGGSESQHGVSAERAAFLAAVADGASKFDVSVTASFDMHTVIQIRVLIVFSEFNSLFNFSF